MVFLFHSRRSPKVSYCQYASRGAVMVLLLAVISYCLSLIPERPTYRIF